MPNLLMNGDFEVGSPPTGWTAKRGTLSREVIDVKAGESAARVTDILFPTLQPLTAPVATSVSGGTYCAYAWVRGAGLTAFLQLLEGDEAPGLSAEGARLGADWVRVRSSKRAQGGLPLTLQAWVGNANSEFVVDVVALWLSLDGSCAEK